MCCFESSSSTRSSPAHRLDYNDAAAQLDISVATVYRRVKSGDIKGRRDKKTGKIWFTQSNLDAARRRLSRRAA
jgi:predicted DNA-binding protein (UPF0251 family)